MADVLDGFEMRASEDELEEDPAFHVFAYGKFFLVNPKKNQFQAMRNSWADVLQIAMSREPPFEFNYPQGVQAMSNCLSNFA